MIHHRSLFPLLVVAMTLCLGVFIFFSFEDRLPSTLNNGNGQIDVVEYRANAHAVLKDLRADLAAAEDDGVRIDVLQRTQTELLALIVPAEEKEIHLELVVVLSAWAQGLTKGDEQKTADTQIRFDTLVNQYPWIE